MPVKAEKRTRHQPKFLLLDRRAQQIANMAIGTDPDILLDTRQTADWLGVSVPWLEIGRSKGYGPPFRKISTKLIRYRIGDLTHWLDDRKHKSTAEYGEDK